MNIIVSFPRSGQHLVETVLRHISEEHEVEWTYCNFYNCCNSLPCSKGNLISKNHDFESVIKIENDSKYIALYRKDIIIQLEAYYRYSVKYYKKKYDYDKLIEFIIGNKDYYDGFVKKWIKNKEKNIIKVEYYDLINNPEKNFKKMFRYLFPNVKIKSEVFSNLNNKDFYVYNPTKNKEVKNKIKEINKIDEELYNKIKKDIKKFI